MKNEASGKDRLIAPRELVDGAMTIEELILAVRIIGNIKSFNSDIGIQDAAYWIAKIMRVHNALIAGAPLPTAAHVTRRFGLRRRMCELLCIGECGCDEPSEELSRSVSYSISERYLSEARLLKGEAGKKYEAIFEMLRSGPIVSRGEVIAFLRKVFAALSVECELTDDASDEELRIALMDAVVLAHPDRHQISEKSAAFEPAYNRLAARLLGLRARIAAGRL